MKKRLKKGLAQKNKVPELGSSSYTKRIALDKTIITVVSVFDRIRY